MTDTTSAQGGETTLTRLADLGTMLRRSDIGLAIGMMAILVVLILPWKWHEKLVSSFLKLD